MISYVSKHGICIVSVVLIEQTTADLQSKLSLNDFTKSDNLSLHVYFEICVSHFKKNRFV